jgi:hypothetical protein
MISKPSLYEVRCPRCDVSFPPETKKCIHCGGPTTEKGAATLAHWEPRDLSRSTAVEASPIEPEPSPIFSIEMAQSEAQPEDPETDSSLLRTLLRSFGSLIWIILLVAFTMARSCGEGQ